MYLFVFTFADSFEGEERLPYREGFEKSTAVITNDEIVELAAKVAAASDI